MKKRTAIYLEPALHQALQVKSAATNRSILMLINEMVREYLAEEAEDLRLMHEQAGEPEISREALLAALQAHDE